jgi:hypothetical protein
LNKEYESIAIYYDTDNLNYRNSVESTFTGELADSDVNAAQGSILFPPLEDWSETYKQKNLKEKGIGALLTFELDSIKPIKVVDDVENENELYPFKVSVKNDDDEDEVNNTHYSLNLMLIDVETNTIAWQGKFDPFYLKFLEKGRRKSNSKNMVRGIIAELEAKGHIVLD